ncbi:MAG: 5'/3'-nucleotidase SurE [Oricola sp.]
MRILITNDDGIHAEGLAALERIAAELSDDVWVVAPETDQSGLAHSLTINDPLRLRRISEKRHALRGTPTDCVIMAMTHVMDGKPDLVLSGVNSGANLADDVTYSGTVAGAMEGTLLGVRSIALSQAYSYADNRRVVPWEVVEHHAPALLQRLTAVDLEPGTFLNVNFPNCGIDEIDGVDVTRQGKLLHGIYVEERADGRGLPYYWIRFGREQSDVHGESDVMALRRNRISVTPLKLDLTDYAMSKRLEEALA